MTAADRDHNSRRIIFHVDVNSAFLSWSAVKRLKEDPDALDLRTVPSVVAGDIETRHGIVTAKSIPAKKYGIRTAEPVAQALKKCPNLILVKSDFKTYREYSRAFLSILRSCSDLVEQASIDEAYVDVTEAVHAKMKRSLEGGGELRQEKARSTCELRQGAAPYAGSSKLRQDAAPYAGSSKLRQAAAAYAEEIKDEIRGTLGFTVNVGISENKLLAKTASDFEKPDRIHTLWPEEVPAKLWPLPIRDLFGCGAATAEKLTGIGIETIGDAARTDAEVLKSLLGEKGGTYIFNASYGIGSDIVHGESEEAKGYSNELTTAEDIDRNNYERMGAPMVRELAEKVASRLARDGMYARTIGVMVKTDSFRRRSRQTTLDESTNRAEIISETAEQLMHRLLQGRDGLFNRGDKIRLIGVSATKIDHGEYHQMNLFDYEKQMEEEKERRALEKKREEDERKRLIEEEKRQIAKQLEEERRSGEQKARESRQRQRQKSLQEMMEKVQKKYGSGAITKGVAVKHEGTEHAETEQTSAASEKDRKTAHSTGIDNL